MSLKLTKMQEADLSAVIEIQSECYTPELHESREAFFKKLSQSPESCLMIFWEEKPVGYFFSVPCLKEQLPLFDDREFNIPDNPDCFYLHDLAVRKIGRKRGIPLKIFQEIYQIAKNKGIHTFRLISVQNTFSKWKAFGFEPVHRISPELQDKLASFKTEAVLMELNMD